MPTKKKIQSTNKKIKTRQNTVDKLYQQVDKIIQEIRPSLQMDGGDVELVSVKAGVVKLNVKGACHGCPMASITFGQGVAGIIKKKIPQIKEVLYW